MTIKKVEENIVRKPVYPRTKKMKSCDFNQPTLSLSGGFRPHSHKQRGDLHPNNGNDKNDYTLQSDENYKTSSCEDSNYKL